MNVEDDLTKRALDEVGKYIESHLDKSDGSVDFGAYVVWQVCVLGNFKWLISSTLPDGMYYEVTYSRDKREFYLNAYKKFESICIPRDCLRETEGDYLMSKETPETLIRGAVDRIVRAGKCVCSSQKNCSGED